MTKKERPTGQGGPGRGQGRKPAQADELLHVLSVRLTRAQREKLERLGGLPWVRAKIDKAKAGLIEPSPQTRQRAPADGAELLVTPLRLNVVQRAKWDELGGGAWLRERIDRARDVR